MAASEGVLRMKRESLTAKIVDAPTWHDTVGDMVGWVCDLTTFGFNADFSAYLALGHDGARPWMMMLRKNKRRFGPAHIPSLGFPNLLFTFSDVVASVCHASTFRDEGVTLPTYESFMATPEGSKKIAESGGVSTVVKAGGALWIPAGRVAHLLYYKAPMKKCKEPDTDFATDIMTPRAVKRL